MYARKREYNAETLEEWRKAYRRLQEGVPSLHIINAEQPADFVLRQAQAIIWHRFGELQAS
jgi:thymidylate kinase